MNNKLCGCELYEHCSICDPDAFRTVSSSETKTTPSPQPNDELERAIDFKLDLDSGKYTYIRYKNGGQMALRHNDEWRNLTGDNLIYFMGCLIEEQQEQLSTLRTEYKKALEALVLIIPMAKGYAFKHDVGNNWKMIEQAEGVALSPLAIETMKGDKV